MDSISRAKAGASMRGIVRFIRTELCKRCRPGGNPSFLRWMYWLTSRAMRSSPTLRRIETPARPTAVFSEGDGRTRTHQGIARCCAAVVGEWVKGNIDAIVHGEILRQGGEIGKFDAARIDGQPRGGFVAMTAGVRVQKNAGDWEWPGEWRARLPRRGQRFWRNC